MAGINANTSTRKKGSSTVGVIFLCIVFLAVAALCTFNIMLGLIGKETTAKITNMRAYDEDGKHSHRLKVSYTFTVDGEVYTGSGTYSSKNPFIVYKDSSTGEYSSPGHGNGTTKITYLPASPSRNSPSDLVAFKDNMMTTVIQVGLIVLMFILMILVIRSHINSRRSERASKHSPTDNTDYPNYTNGI